MRTVSTKAILYFLVSSLRSIGHLVYDPALQKFFVLETKKQSCKSSKIDQPSRENIFKVVPSWDLDLLRRQLLRRQRKLDGWGVRAAWQRGCILSSHPAAAGLILGISKNFSHDVAEIA